MNHFGYTSIRLAEEPLQDLAGYFEEFVNLVERENGGEEWKDKENIDIISEDILKDLHALVEDAKKFVEI